MAQRRKAKHYRMYDPDTIVKEAARGNNKHAMALWAALHYRDIPNPICHTVRGTWVVWMGRNTVYRFLRDAGFVYSARYGVWTRRTKTRAARRKEIAQ